MDDARSVPQTSNQVMKMRSGGKVKRALAQYSYPLTVSAGVHLCRQDMSSMVKKMAHNTKGALLTFQQHPFYPPGQHTFVF